MYVYTAGCVCIMASFPLQHADPCTFIPLDTIEVKPINEALRWALNSMLDIHMDVSSNCKMYFSTLALTSPQGARW